MARTKEKLLARKKRQTRVRQKISGTPECPRLNVYRSLKHIYAQLIDDVNGATLVSASTMEPGIRSKLSVSGNAEAAKEVGELLAERARESGIEEVVFDRAGYLFHGRVKALAEGAREKGLKF